MRARQPDAMSDRMKAKYAKYVPRQRAANEAHGQAVNLMALPAYKPPPPMVPVRPGADMHQQFRSRGV